MRDARTPEGPDLLTTEQVIERLLEDETLSRAAATCVLPAVRVGSSWRFRRADLDSWIAAEREKSRRSSA